MRRSLGTNNSEEGDKAFSCFTDRARGYAIDFCFEDGNRRAMQYADLVDVEYNMDLGGLILEGIGKRVTVLGIHLETLYEQILDHEVGRVVERHEPEHMMKTVADKGETYVRQLLWEKL